MRDFTKHFDLPPLQHDDDIVVVSAACHALEDAAKSWMHSMSPEECARALRYRFQKDRDIYIASRVFLRACLSHYLKIEMEQVTFAYTGEGKPILDPAHHPNAIEFNLSHTEGLVAIVFSRKRRVGIDVERSRFVLDPLEIANKFFTQTESTWLRSLPENERQLAFLDCWTRKEAFAKATGLGLSETLSPDFAADPRITTSFTYHPLSLGSNYVGVVAVEGKSRVPKQVFASSLPTPIESEDAYVPSMRTSQAALILTPSCG